MQRSPAPPDYPGITGAAGDRESYLLALEAEGARPEALLGMAQVWQARANPSGLGTLAVKTVTTRTCTPRSAAASTA